VPRPNKWEGCSSRTCSSIMASQRTLCRIETQSSRASFGKPCGSAWGWSLRWAPHSDLKKFRYGRIGNKRPFLCRLFLYILFPLTINFFLKPFINCWMIRIKMFLQTCYATCFIICYWTFL
jgi:hypothetical protein